MSIQLIDFPGWWLVLWYFIRLLGSIGALFYGVKYIMESIRFKSMHYDFSTIFTILGICLVIIAYNFFPPILVFTWI